MCYTCSCALGAASTGWQHRAAAGTGGRQAGWGAPGSRGEPRARLRGAAGVIAPGPMKQVKQAAQAKGIGLSRHASIWGGGHGGPTQASWAPRPAIGSTALAAGGRPRAVTPRLQQTMSHHSTAYRTTWLPGLEEIERDAGAELGRRDPARPPPASQAAHAASQSKREQGWAPEQHAAHSRTARRRMQGATRPRRLALRAPSPAAAAPPPPAPPLPPQTRRRRRPQIRRRPTP